MCGVSGKGCNWGKARWLPLFKNNSQRVLIAVGSTPRHWESQPFSSEGGISWHSMAPTTCFWSPWRPGPSSLEMLLSHQVPVAMFSFDTILLTFDEWTRRRSWIRLGQSINCSAPGMDTSWLKWWPSFYVYTEYSNDTYSAWKLLCINTYLLPSRSSSNSVFQFYRWGNLRPSEEK